MCGAEKADEGLEEKNVKKRGCLLSSSRLPAGRPTFFFFVPAPPKMRRSSVDAHGRPQIGLDKGGGKSHGLVHSKGSARFFFFLRAEGTQLNHPAKQWSAAQSTGTERWATVLSAHCGRWSGQRRPCPVPRRGGTPEFGQSAPAFQPTHPARSDERNGNAKLTVATAAARGRAWGGGNAGGV